MNLNQQIPTTPPTGGNSSPEFLSLRIRVRPDLRTIQHDSSSLKLEDPVRGKFFQIGRREYALIQLLNGERTVQEAIDVLNRADCTNSLVKNPESTDEKLYSPEIAGSILNWLTGNNLLVNDSQENSNRLAATANRISAQKRLGLLNLVSFKISLGNPTRLLAAMTPAVGRVFSYTAFFVWLSVIVWAGQVLVADGERFADASLGILSSGRWFWLLVCWLALKVIHEAAHGIACIKYGGEVREAGVLFLLFTPMAYVDVTSSWRFESRRQRMMVAAAGMYAELFVAAIAAIAWSRLQPGVASDICYNLVIMAGLTTILFNANPLMRFDGYYLATDVMAIPNLYTRSQTWLIGVGRNVLFGFAKSDCGETGWKRIVIMLYGIAAFCWKVLLTASLLIAASCLPGGAGWMLALVGGLFWVGMPLYAQIQQTRNLMNSQPINWRRFAVTGTCLATLLAAGIFFLAAPRTAMSPAMVQIRDQQIIRAPVDGFIVDIHVADGVMVQQGEPLMTLSNPDLQVRIAETQAGIKQSEIRCRVHRQLDELALCQAETHKQQSLQEQLSELNAQHQELVLRAPIDGLVTCRQLKNLAGSYVKRGDAIVTIGDPAATEIVVSIDQQQVNSIREITDQPVRVLLPGTGVLTGHVTHLTPRASDIPLADQWCVPQGGPLPVRLQAGTEQQSKSQYRLLEPRLNATVTLNLPEGIDAEQLRSGQLGKAFLHTQRQSLASYLYVSTQRWIRDKVAMSLGS